MQIRVPPLGESITEATVSRWLKREGEPVKVGDTLVELETDKITVEVPAAKGGVLGTRAKLEGDVVKVDEVLGELDESAVATVAAAAEAPAGATSPAVSAVSRAVESTAAPAVAAATPTAPVRDVRAAPSAVRLAAASGINLSDIEGTGRGGVVSKPDVIAAAAAAGSADGGRQRAEAMPSAAAMVPASSASAVSRPPSAVSSGVRETREKMSTRRKRIAENLLQAQHATAHLTTFNEIDMSAIMALRERMKEKEKRSMA